MWTVFKVFIEFVTVLLLAQMVKTVMQETGVGSLGREDPLEKILATHCRILAWRVLWTEDAGGL